MKTIMLLLILGIIGQSKLNAQASFAELDNNKVIYPSPTAASLGKYGEYPVSLYNGLVHIGQDIVTVKSGRLELNVSLSYHASGNKPSDIPGWVGLGFSLNAGGVITRIIRDLPDDLQGGFYISNDGVKSLWNSYPNSEFIEQYFSGSIDPRSDIYQFNFCGKTGEFVFDWDRNIHFKRQVPFKIEVLGGLGGFGGFKVTTDNGTIYTFDQAEHTQLGSTSTDAPISSWYLTKIINLSGDSIILKYTEPMNKFRYKQYSTEKEVVGQISGAQLVTGPTFNETSSRDEVIYLDEIDFNNGKLKFGTSSRADPYFIPAGINPSNVAEDKLDLITLEDNNNNIIKQWKFEYYENNTERLKLKNLIVQGSDQMDVQKYSFEYNTPKLPVPLPGPNPANPYISNDIDYWGYYNGAINGDNRIPKMYINEYDQYVGSADRTIKPSYVQAEILNKITYPTGGYTKFEYESNDYSAQGESFAKNKNPLFATPPPEHYSFLYDRDNGGFEVDPATISFTLTEPTHINEQYSCGSAGPLHSWANPGTMYNYDYQLSAGTHTLRSILNTDELLSPNSADITKAAGTVTVYKASPVTPLDAKIGPGVRIRSIETNDGKTTTTRRFEYKLGGSQNSTKSSGFLSVFPAFYVPLQRIALNMSGYYVTSEPINDIGEGAPVGYRRVVERLQDSSYIVHNYTSYDEYPDETMPFLNGYSDSQLAHMSPNGFRRGLETNTSYYNTDGVIQKTIINQYAVLPESITDVQSIELKPTVGIATSTGGPVNYINATLSALYYIHSCFLYDSVRIEETFDKNGQNPIITSIFKYYDNVKHLQPTRIKRNSSNGSVLITSTSFPDDFAPGIPFIDYMTANHLISFPIERVVYEQKGGINRIISGNIITYKTEGTGLPDQLFELENSSPILQSNFKFSNRVKGILPPSSLPSQYNADTHYHLSLTYTQYDNKGNPLESISRNGIKTCYLWGYKHELPVAQIVGIDYPTALGKINNPSMLDNPPSDEDLRAELNTLRTIPNAFVTTYTYAPLTGVTSQSDVSGVTTYYEYDSFSRLSVIRDQDHSILRKYRYNYTSQPEKTSFYKSDAINDDYYSQNCSPGETPASYHVSVPQGKFTSYIDQQTANQLAQQYAQDLANQYGSCVILNISIYGENNHGVSITVQLHNVASGQDYSYTVDPHDGRILGEVPPGNYNITLTPQSSGGWYNYSVGCGYYDAGPGSITFYGIDITSSCNSITID